jgi:hypothetical protein
MSLCQTPGNILAFAMTRTTLHVPIHDSRDSAGNGEVVNMKTQTFSLRTTMLFMVIAGGIAMAMRMWLHSSDVTIHSFTWELLSDCRSEGRPLIVLIHGDPGGNHQYVVAESMLTDAAFRKSAREHGAVICAIDRVMDSRIAEEVTLRHGIVSDSGRIAILFSPDTLEEPLVISEVANAEDLTGLLVRAAPP